jgi:transcriptional regulator with XRE-family HTH domain
MPSLGDRLRLAREKKNLKQTQVMAKTGINNKTLSGYEKNVSEPDVETLKILAELYEVSVDWLTGRTMYSKNKADENEFILKEITAKYHIDLTKPAVREKLERIIQIVADDPDKN